MSSCIGMEMKAFAWGLLLTFRQGEEKRSAWTQSSRKHIRDIVTMQMRMTVVFGWFMGLVKGVTFQLVGKE